MTLNILINYFKPKQMKLTKLFFLFAIGILIASCGSKDEVAPTINITSPDDNITITAGDEIQLSASVSDDEELASIIITDGTTPTSITTFDSPTAHAVAYTVTVPEDSPAGTLTLTITARDVEGNEASATRTITVEELVVGCQAAASCIDAAMTTFVVTTPEGTPADAMIEVVGSFNDWPGELDPAYVLTKNGDNCYCIAVAFDADAQFKFRRDGSWDKVEKDADGEEIDNRVFTYAAGEVVNITVAKWADQ
jgi:hypothetical protein